MAEAMYQAILPDIKDIKFRDTKVDALVNGNCLEITIYSQTIPKLRAIANSFLRTLFATEKVFRELKIRVREHD